MLHARPDVPGVGPALAGARASEVDELEALLLEHRSDDSERTRNLARAVAEACLEGDHLWEDLGLKDRTALSALLRQRFTTLYFLNRENMRWKRFLYKQLCDRLEARLCAAPNCASCCDRRACFGAE